MVPDSIKLKEIKPVLSGYVREAGTLLKPETIPEVKVVHDVRVLMKKSRAVMKLIESQIDKTVFDKEYTTFRDVGRMMRDWRETSVHRRTLKELKKKHPDIFNRLEGYPAIELLLKDNNTKSELSPEVMDNLAHIREMLGKAEYRIRFRNLSNLDPHHLLKDLENSYMEVATCYRAARICTKPAKLHEFRKRTKDFLYQLYFFRTLRPKTVKDLEKRLEILAQNLGKYNDMAVLINALGYKFRSSGSNNDALDELIILIMNEQDRFLSKIWPESYRIFSPGRKLINLLGYKILMI